MTVQIKQTLTKIYPADQAAAVYERLKKRLAEFQADLPDRMPAEGPPFAAADVVLITYGDSLRQAGQPPLQTLGDFARNRLSGLISTIHILPFFPYSSDDGFSILDYYAVDPVLGDWDDIQRLGADFGLMVDAVFNHMSAQSEWFRRFLADDPAYRGLFRAESPGADLSSITRPRAHPLLTPFRTDSGETVHVWTTFSADQVDLDFRQPDTLLRMLDVLLYYVGKGARMIRLDAIAYLWKTVGSSGIHLPEVHAVVRLMRAVLDVVAPGVLLITETNVPHDENVAYFGSGADEAQMVYNFTLPPLLFHTLLAGEAAKLRAWVNTLTTPSDRTTFFNFTASHDGIGVRPVEGILDAEELAALIAQVEARDGRVSYKRDSDGNQSPYELNVTYVDAVADPAQPLEVQVRRFMVSQAIQLALAGVPGIYLHSLLGSHNWVEGRAQTGHNRTINREKLAYEAVTADLADPESFRAKVFGAYTALIATRIRQPAFHPNAAQQALDLGNDGVFALLRTAVDGAQRLLALFNVTGQPQTVDLGEYVAGSAPDLLGGAAVTSPAELAPYQVLWLDLDSA